MKYYNVPPTTPFGEAHDKTRQIMVLIGHIQSIAFATEDAENIIHCLEMIRSTSFTSIVNIKNNIKSAPVSDAGVVCWFVRTEQELTHAIQYVRSTEDRCEEYPHKSNFADRYRKARKDLNSILSDIDKMIDLHGVELISTIADVVPQIIEIAKNKEEV